MRPNVSLENAVQQLLVEAQSPKTAAYNTAPAAVPTDLSAGLHKLASALRTAPVPEVTFEHLHRVKEAVYGR